MRPDTREVIEMQLLPAMKLVKGKLEREVEKQSMDEFVFCFKNCYTEKETEMYVTRKFPSLKQSDVGIGFQKFLALIEKVSREAYLKDAEDCANVRRIEARDNSEEAKRSQGEASTSHKCEPNCNKHYPEI
ncbi:hypothetical protein ISN45_Aa02g004410 [Arabidopsis thaliana x Arabidopsis arenosa]|uniref:Uncharacterized protein n=1 Tax=Arabidopsis thaliana x Arabidopsis arenosa TaxID=1240361 RepID=A0A8T2BGF2_9BRAS|nr:hypothetical protein ISN45_Aa02g004410 [Arabidopsis thaliana x Arabidopsis arenosa]